MHEEGHIFTNPAAKIKEPKVGKRIPKFLTERELEHLREACNTAMEKAIFEFMFSTGYRIGEVVTLDKNCINWSNLSAIVRGQLAQQEKGIAAAVLSKKNLWRTDAHFSFFIFGVMSTYQPEAEFVKKLHTQLVNRLFYPQKRLPYYEYCCMIKRTKFILYKK